MLGSGVGCRRGPPETQVGAKMEQTWPLLVFLLGPSVAFFSFFGAIVGPTPGRDPLCLEGVGMVRIAPPPLSNHYHHLSLSDSDRLRLVVLS